MDNGYSKPEWDNGLLISRILALRAEEVKMLGYRHYADVSLVPKMVESTEQVLAFLRELAEGQTLRRARSGRTQGLAKDELGPTRWSRGMRPMCRRSRASPSTPSPAGSEGIPARNRRCPTACSSSERLYQGTSSPTPAPCGNAGRTQFPHRTRRPSSSASSFDLYARDTKKGGAWMDSAITRRRIGNGIETPVAYLVCNFPAR